LVNPINQTNLGGLSTTSVINPSKSYQAALSREQANRSADLRNGHQAAMHWQRADIR
jgi:hypothetical protein